MEGALKKGRRGRSREKGEEGGKNERTLLTLQYGFRECLPDWDIGNRVQSWVTAGF